MSKKPSAFWALSVVMSCVLLVMLNGCGARKPRDPFDQALVPPPPDYSNMDAWAAHPAKADPADRTPCREITDNQSVADIDVFFLYPTTLTGSRKGEKAWNAAIDDDALNAKTDSSTILFQASLFNGVGRVFAPRYRQAHIHSFYGKDKESAAKALDTAYADVVAAFLYYLEHENNGRPFILAGHSQGGRHAMYLLRDRIENTLLENRLVAAYLVGWPVRKDFFKKIQPCRLPNDTGCFCSWRTWERDYGLRHAADSAVVCTNPLLWSTEEGKYAPETANLGSVIRPFCAVYPAIADAEVYNGVLLCSKPRFPGSILFIRKNYHVGDLNLYYMNVRENAIERARAFWK